jgi:phage tail-like protein
MDNFDPYDNPLSNFSFNTAYPDCLFYVFFDDKLQGAFTEVGGLQTEIDIMEYPEGGNNSFVHHLPGRTKTGNLVLKRGMTVKNDFQKWLIDVSNGKIQRRHISVVMYNLESLELKRWNFINAYPVKWIGPQMRAFQGTAAVETLELAHEGMLLG